ncbi:MAG: DNA replication and repair protein RecF [bacterium]|nr:DNA replication and repair protein RecF [bacterium]
MVLYFRSMGIKKVRLIDFRNFKKKVLEFSDGITVIVGPNASGKTNILESLFLLSSGKSFKAKIEAEIIAHNASITRLCSTGYDGQASLEVVITRGENGWPKKRLLTNGVSKRLIDFAGNFRVTLFGPWDMDLVTGSPSLRRKFMDMVLSQIDREYRRAILLYEKGLRQRNKLLYRIREEGLSRSQLLFWDKLLIKNGNYISTKRKEFVDFINATGSLNDQEFKLTYDNSAISQGRLEQYANEEIASATTLVGPHRDDIRFSITNFQLSNPKKRDLSIYGSRGEQRMAVLWLKLAELAFIEAKTGERPTLLLDDIFSELDHEHRKVVTKVLGKQQTIITTADKHFLKGLKNNSVLYFPQDVR